MIVSVFATTATTAVTKVLVVMVFVSFSGVDWPGHAPEHTTIRGGVMEDQFAEGWPSIGVATVT